MKKEYYDLQDRQSSCNRVREIIPWLEEGLRAVSTMYDEHSSDQNSKDNIFRLKGNIFYRLVSAEHIYGLLLKELYNVERFCQEQESLKKANTYFSAPAYMELFEMQISALFDAVIFNMVSAIDYFSHIICYICKKQKSDTQYWTKLAKAVRGQNNELSSLICSKAIDNADREFFGKLYDYRSDLIHNKREIHQTSLSHEIMSGKFSIKVSMTKTEMKYFKRILIDHDSDKIFTLPYLLEWIIKTTANYIEAILTELVKDIKANSVYNENIRGANGKGAFVLMYVNPVTNVGEPVSEMQWKKFKGASPFKNG